MQHMLPAAAHNAWLCGAEVCSGSSGLFCCVFACLQPPAVAQGQGLWSSPVEGQLPSSLETTPSDVLPAASLGAVGTSSRRASNDKHAAQHDSTQPDGYRSQHQQHSGSSGQAGSSSRQPFAAVPACSAASAREDFSPPAPTVVLPDVPAVACSGAAAGSVLAAHASSSQMAVCSSNSSVVRQPPPPKQPVTMREPLR